MTLRLRRFIGMVAVIGLILLATAEAALAHPNDWDTWKTYRKAHMPKLMSKPDLPADEVFHGTAAVEWEAWLRQQARLERLREKWEAFDAAYEAAMAADDVDEPVVASEGIGTPPAPPTAGSINWLAVADCESGDSDGQPPYTPDWHIDSRYDGGLQFDPPTWLAYGGGEFAQYAWQATPSQQITIANRVAAAEGDLGAWPICGQYG